MTLSPEMEPAAPSTPPSARRSRTYRLLVLAIAHVQDRLSSMLGVSRGHRIDTVVAMLQNNSRRAPGFWLQLFLAMGIATLGLVLGSTAVVIGGMLVSPLMGPIVELGMGLAVGSSLLVIRAFLRVLLSVAMVIFGAGLLTLILPFHDVTSEIAARTAPTLLDLLVAAFCALAAAYTTVRQTADTTAAAAGTAVGIALVPPLCVTGFGLGTGSGELAAGAALLFTANFSAILTLAVASFLLLGYNAVEASSLEEAYLGTKETFLDLWALRAHARLREVFGSRYGFAMRLLVPVVILAGVAVPLTHALHEVAWEVRVRDSVRRLLDAESMRTVQSALIVDRHGVTLRLLVVGSPDTAEALQRRLETRVAAASGVTPSVVVTSVPDARTLGATLARANMQSRAGTPAALDAAGVQRVLASVLLSTWPTPAAGMLLGWRLEIAPNEPTVVTVRHLGAPLGASGELMLARALGAALQLPVRVSDHALPLAARSASDIADSSWFRFAMSTVAEAAAIDSVTVCVVRPRRRSARGGAAPGLPPDTEIESALRGTARALGAQLEVASGATWSIRVARERCPLASTSPAARP